MGNCKHHNVSFLGILQYRTYPEKCFICNDCHTVITDYVTHMDMELYADKKEMLLNL